MIFFLRQKKNQILRKIDTFQNLVRIDILHSSTHKVGLHRNLQMITWQILRMFHYSPVDYSIGDQSAGFAYYSVADYSDAYYVIADYSVAYYSVE